MYVVSPGCADYQVWPKLAKREKELEEQGDEAGSMNMGSE